MACPSIIVALRGTDCVTTTVPPSRQVSSNEASRTATSRSRVTFALVGPRSPGTSAFDEICFACTHTAVMRRNAIVTNKRSMNGIMLMSVVIDLRLLPPPPTSTPAMELSSLRAGRQ